MIRWLEKGKPIKKAIAKANDKYPLEALVAACAGASGNPTPAATESPLAPSTPPASALAQVGPSSSPVGSVAPVTASGA